MDAPAKVISTFGFEYSIMAERPRDIYVEEIMTKAPVIGSPDMTIREAAFLMKSWKVGSVIIVEDGTPVGIITERDLVDKVVADNKSPSKIAVREIMSSPLITASPRDTLASAAKRMASLGVRRLPVVVGDQLMGMLTENDILRISPLLIELTREWRSVGRTEVGEEHQEIREGMEEESLVGYCENCENFSYDLQSVGGVGGGRGSLLCRECREIFLRNPTE